MRKVILALVSFVFVSPAFADSYSNYDAMVAAHAAANGVPESLVRRIIKRESGGRPGVVSRGNYGLMQIKLATARSMGYSGSAAGLLDANTNMTYAVKYLAGAYHAAGGNESRAVHYYASGYYYAAKRQGLTTQVSAREAMFAQPAAFAQPTAFAAVGYGGRTNALGEATPVFQVASAGDGAFAMSEPHHHHHHK
jgi:soluble lytic murein transglycosylase-like protein